MISLRQLDLLNTKAAPRLRGFSLPYSKEPTTRPSIGRTPAVVCGHKGLPAHPPTNIHWWVLAITTKAGLLRPREPAASRPSGSQFPGDQNQVV
jgi:hypothetical protein